MPVKSLHKVQKHIAKKKGSRGSLALHQNGRDAHRLQRASNREDKVSRIIANRQKLNQPYLERLSFFHASLQFHNQATFDLAGVQNLITTFLHRADIELRELHDSRRSGRPPNARENTLKDRTEREFSEYRSGFWVPDLEDPANVEMLSTWNGDWAGLAKLKYIRIDENGGKKASNFPPKGLS